MRRDKRKQKINFDFGYITPKKREFSEDERHDYIVAHRWDLQMELKERFNSDDN